MTSPEQRIKELANRSAIAPADAARLLAAVRTEPLRARDARNPFERWSGERTALGGVIVALVMVAMSRAGVRSDGAFDQHHTASPISIATAFVDQLVAFPLPALVYWAVARIFATRARFVDLLGAVGLSRAPSVLGCGWLALTHQFFSLETLSPALALLAVTPSLVLFGFHIFLLVVGVRTATGLRGGRLALVFVVALVAAEIASKVVLHFIQR